MFKENEEIGLQDCNGKEIKIGDRVRVKNWFNKDQYVEENVTCKVVWEKLAISLQRTDISDSKFMSCYYSRTDQLEVL